jgi:hypothetical protein
MIVACVAVLVGGITLTAASRSALAAGTSGAVTQVEYLANNPSNPQLLVQLNYNGSVNYTAQQTSPGCGVPALSADSMKLLMSLAQSTLLAGKNATIYYNACGSTNYIYDIVLAR